MRQERQIELLERALALRTDQSPSISKRLASDYLDPARFAQEMRVLADTCPLVVGDASELSQPGSYVAHAQAGCRVAVVRSKEGELSAFANACRHRGMRLLGERQGSVGRSIVCPYHGWTYAPSGELLHVPHAEGFPGCTEQSLPRYGVSLRHGLIWIQKDELSPDVDAFLGSDLSAELSAWELDSHVSAERVTGARACNWKLLVDGGLEAYHLKRAHEDTVYPYFLDNVALIDFFGRHARIVMVKRTIEECRSLPREQWKLLDHTNVLYFLFPSTFLLVQKDRVTHVAMVPQAVDRSDFVISTLVRRLPETDKQRTFFQHNSRLVNETLLEDQLLADAIHDNLAAGAATELTFGRFEHAIAQFHSELDGLMPPASHVSDVPPCSLRSARRAPA